MLTFEFTGVEGRMTESEILTSGMVGKTVQILFDDSWTGLSKIIVFRSGEICRTADGAETAVAIPGDVLSRPWRRLYVGVYGTDDDGAVVIPTIMAEGPMIRYGADPTENPEAEDLPVWKNLQEQIGNLTQLNTEDRSSLVAAINDNCEKLADLSDAFDSHLAQLGQLSDLQTEAKDSLVAAINEIHSRLGTSEGTGLSEAAAALLIEILRHGIYDSDQAANIDALEAELAPTGDDSGGGDVTPEEPDTPAEPETMPTSLSVTYSGGDVPVGTPLTELTGVTVVAHYSDGSYQAVTDYTLSGQIEEGENTITATYYTLSVSFTVTGTAIVLVGISATYSGGDVPVGTPLTELGGIIVMATFSDGTRRPVSGYTLSGQIGEGRNTIRVTYEDKTTGFVVTGVAEEAEAVMTGISATYSGGDVPAGTALTDLEGITVTAHYSDGISMMVEDFDLSGTIAEGENTITVTYEGHTADFTVTGTASAPATGQTETLELVYAASYPNVTTFAYTEQASAGNYLVAKQGSLAGGVLSVDFDESCINWNLNLYVFDADGNPYCQTDKAFTSLRHPTYGLDIRWMGDMDTDYVPGSAFEWTDVGAGVGFGTVLAPFTIQLPAGCTCIACIRAGSSGISNFTTWAKDGGITFTVTTK